MGRMTPVWRFSFVVSTLTVAILYLFVSELLPLLPGTGISVKLIKAITTFIASVGTYFTLAKVLSILLLWIPWLRRRLLGPAFLEGTWIGCYRTPAGDPRFTVEYFEQDLETLVIRGKAVDDADAVHVQWNSKSVTVDQVAGTVIYAYSCDHHEREVSFQGVAVFHLERPDRSRPANVLDGYSADLIDGQRSHNRQFKISDQMVPWDEAVKQAKDRFSGKGSLGSKATAA